MKQLKTAKEFIKENLTDHWQGGKAQYTGEDVEKAMIEFAKLHVQTALESAAKNAELDYWEGSCRECGSNIIDEKSILNSYPLDRIL